MIDLNVNSVIENDPQSIKNDDKDSRETFLGVVFNFIIFSVDCFSDLQSNLGLLSSMVAGCLYSITNFLDQKVDLNYYGRGVGNITSNGALTITTDDYYNKDYPLIGNKSFVETAQRNFSYELERVINPQNLIMLSIYALIAGVIINASGKLIRSHTHSIKDQATKKSNRFHASMHKEYIVNALDGGVSSLQVAFLVYVILTAALSLLIHPGEIYSQSISSQNDTLLLNTTQRFKEPLETSLKTDYRNIFFSEINAHSLEGGNKMLPIKSGISATVMLEITLSYAAKLSVVNEGQSPSIGAASVETAVLFILGCFIKNYGADLRKNRLLVNHSCLTSSNNGAESEVRIENTPEVIVPTSVDEMERSI